VNRLTGRQGALWADCYHSRSLTTPRAVRASLAYVLLNFRKHLAAPPGIDPCSSGPSFTGWAPRLPAPPDAAIFRPTLSAVPSTTWLGRAGWLRAGGPLHPDEGPRPVRPPRPPPCPPARPPPCAAPLLTLLRPTTAISSALRPDHRPPTTATNSYSARPQPGPHPVRSSPP